MSLFLGMAKEEHYYTKFEKGKLYHIYNRAIDKKPLFLNDGNYKYFLRKFFSYMKYVVEIYVYALLGNHFHFAIKVKEHFKSQKLTLSEQKLTEVHELVSRRLRRFFQCYALAFNKQHNRTGTLFQTPFKRALIESEEHLRTLICYIHNNPQKHKLIADFKNWKWSSYQAILKNKRTPLKKEAVINLFGDKPNFILCHHT